MEPVTDEYETASSDRRYVIYDEESDTYLFRTVSKYTWVDSPIKATTYQYPDDIYTVRDMHRAGKGKVVCFIVRTEEKIKATYTRID